MKRQNNVAAQRPGTAIKLPRSERPPSCRILRNLPNSSQHSPHDLCHGWDLPRWLPAPILFCFVFQLAEGLVEKGAGLDKVLQRPPCNNTMSLFLVCAFKFLSLIHVDSQSVNVSGSLFYVLLSVPSLLQVSTSLCVWVEHFKP